jgi:general secretion pathway protein C
VAGAPEQSWAAVLDEETGEHLVVRVNDVLKDRAQVLRIERRRLVLENGPRREELALSEEPAPRTTPARTARATPRPSARSRSKEDVQARIERLAENRFSLSRDEVQEAARNPAGLFSQARILPKYDAGQMVGVQVNAIKTGSTLEEIGLQNGDTISEVNGMRITSPEDSTEVLRELAQANQFTVVVTGADGQERTLTYELEE